MAELDFIGNFGQLLIVWKPRVDQGFSNSDIYITGEVSGLMEVVFAKITGDRSLDKRFMRILWLEEGN